LTSILGCLISLSKLTCQNSFYTKILPPHSSSKSLLSTISYIIINEHLLDCSSQKTWC
jgi:hypothetical protein